MSMNKPKPDFKIEMPILDWLNVLYYLTKVDAVNKGFVDFNVERGSVATLPDGTPTFKDVLWESACDSSAFGNDRLFCLQMPDEETDDWPTIEQRYRKHQADAKNNSWEARYYTDAFIAKRKREHEAEALLLKEYGEYITEVGYLGPCLVFWVCW